MAAALSFEDMECLAFSVFDETLDFEPSILEDITMSEEPPLTRPVAEPPPQIVSEPPPPIQRAAAPLQTTKPTTLPTNRQPLSAAPRLLYEPNSPPCSPPPPPIQRAAAPLQTTKTTLPTNRQPLSAAPRNLYEPKSPPPSSPPPIQRAAAPLQTTKPTLPTNRQPLSSAPRNLYEPKSPPPSSPPPQIVSEPPPIQRAAAPLQTTTLPTNRQPLLAAPRNLYEPKSPPPPPPIQRAVAPHHPSVQTTNDYLFRQDPRSLYESFTPTVPKITVTVDQSKKRRIFSQNDFDLRNKITGKKADNEQRRQVTYHTNTMGVLAIRQDGYTLTDGWKSISCDDHGSLLNDMIVMRIEKLYLVDETSREMWLDLKKATFQSDDDSYHDFLLLIRERVMNNPKSFTPCRFCRRVDCHRWLATVCGIARFAHCCGISPIKH